MTTVNLKYPFEHNGKTISELTFRRANLGDFCRADKVDGENTKTAALLAGMSDTSLPVIQRLDFEDIAAVLDVAGPLMGNGQPAIAVQLPE